MSIPIQFKQSTVNTVPASLLPGEPAAYITPTGATLFVGDSGGVPRVIGGTGAFVPTTGGTMTGPLTLNGNPATALIAAPKQYVDTQVATKISQAQADARYLQLGGGVLTGALTLAADPAVPLGAATRQYVDAGVATRLTQAQADARYSLLGHTHVESQITNLNRTRWLGAWSAGSYVINDMVTNGGTTFVCIANTSAQPPGAGWSVMGAAGAGVTIAASAPVAPAAGDLWYRTSGNVGLFVWFVDGNSSQWISTDQSSAYFANMLQLIGGTMTGELIISPNPAIPVGLAMQGTYTGAAITIPSGQSIALDATGDVRIRYNSATTNIEFIRGGIVKQTISLA